MLQEAGSLQADSLPVLIPDLDFPERGSRRRRVLSRHRPPGWTGRIPLSRCPRGRRYPCPAILAAGGGQHPVRFLRLPARGGLHLPTQAGLWDIDAEGIHQVFAPEIGDRDLRTFLPLPHPATIAASRTAAESPPIYHDRNLR